MKNKLSPSEILHKIAEYYGKTIQEMSINAGYERAQAFYDVVNGKTKRISTTMAGNIMSAFPEINESWILTGEGDMLRPDSTIPRAAGEIKADDQGELLQVVKQQTEIASRLIAQNEALLQKLEKLEQRNEKLEQKLEELEKEPESGKGTGPNEARIQQ